MVNVTMVNVNVTIVRSACSLPCTANLLLLCMVAHGYSKQLTLGKKEITTILKNWIIG